jgi:hypothetical protein
MRKLIIKLSAAAMVAASAVAALQGAASASDVIAPHRPAAPAAPGH